MSVESCDKEIQYWIQLLVKNRQILKKGLTNVFCVVVLAIFPQLSGGSSRNRFEVLDHMVLIVVLHLSEKVPIGTSTELEPSIVKCQIPPDFFELLWSIANVLLEPSIECFGRKTEPLESTSLVVGGLIHRFIEVLGLER